MTRTELGVVMVRFPQWGVQVVCERLPDAARNMYGIASYPFSVNIYSSSIRIPEVGSAQVRIPTALPSNLFAQLDLPFPEYTLRNIQPNYGPSLSRERMYYPTSIPGNSSEPDTLMTSMLPIQTHSRSSDCELAILTDLIHS